MASRRAPQALRSSLSQLAKNSASTGARFTPLLASRAALPAVARTAASSVSVQQTRGLKTIDFAGTKEDVYGMNSVQLMSGTWLTHPRAC
jgi:ketol-acid reductoisomerase